jgi:hypothetical protein
MKLLLCLNCNDLFNLDFDEKSCKCSFTKGKYIDQLNAIYSGNSAVPLGFSNPSLSNAIRNQPKEGLGEEFTAFVIPENCETFVKV